MSIQAAIATVGSNDVCIFGRNMYENFKASPTAMISAYLQLVTLCLSIILLGKALEGTRIPFVFAITILTILSNIGEVLWDSTYQCDLDIAYGSKSYINGYPVIFYLSNVYNYIFFLYSYELGNEFAGMWNRFCELNGELSLLSCFFKLFSFFTINVDKFCITPVYISLQSVHGWRIFVQQVVQVLNKQTLARMSVLSAFKGHKAPALVAIALNNGQHAELVRDCVKLVLISL